MVFNNYADLEVAFAEKKVHPLDLKQAVTKQLNTLLQPIREKFSSPELQKLSAEAYPEEHAARLQREKMLKASSSNSGDGKKKSKAPAPKKKNTAIDISKLDIRVGEIVKIEAHPDADSLYVEQINVGDPSGPRTVVSGLAKYYSLEEMQGRKVLVLLNMKPTKLRGVQSTAMVLCATAADKSKVELLDPPAGTKAGERVQFSGYEYTEDETTELARCNEKQRAAILLDLKTDASKNASYKGVQMMTTAGAVTVPSLCDSMIA